ncbi:MAG: NAD-binding protein [Treponema sp.]|jgi:2-hydroxy-3-oxopropionate reductase|nr:NAD-binding protein [Treponema sp.]
MIRAAGIIGLGVMGLPMARNLARKLPEEAREAGLLVYDADQRRIDELTAESAGGKDGAARIIPVGDAGELARRADLVFLSLPTSEVVRGVTLGDGNGPGIAGFLKKGSIVADTSTTETGVVKALAAELEKRGIEFADTPVSGGEKGAREGTLSFMVGAKDDVFDAVRDYCAAMGSSVVHMGGIASGQIAKAVNQMIVGAAFAAIAESFSLGVKSGLDAKRLYEALKGGWAGSRVLDVAAGDMFSREFKPGGTVDIHWKDLGYALSLSKDTDVPVPVTALVHELFKAARAHGDGRKSQSAVVRLWDSLLNQEVK